MCFTPSAFTSSVRSRCPGIPSAPLEAMTIPAPWWALMAFDSSAVLAILARAGYPAWFRYQKYREEFTREDCIITVDETPIGIFLELEGPGEWIDATAARLGFTPADYITASYAKLYREHVEQHGGDPTAMRFSL